MKYFWWSCRGNLKLVTLSFPLRNEVTTLSSSTQTPPSIQQFTLIRMAMQRPGWKCEITSTLCLVAGLCSLLRKIRQNDITTLPWQLWRALAHQSPSALVSVPRGIWWATKVNPSLTGSRTATPRDMRDRPKWRWKSSQTCPAPKWPLVYLGWIWHFSRIQSWILLDKIVQFLFR